MSLTHRSTHISEKYTSYDNTHEYTQTQATHRMYPFLAVLDSRFDRVFAAAAPQKWLKEVSVQ